MILIDPMIFEDPRMNEVWKPLFANGEYISRYLISNYGNIYDLEEDKYCNTRLDGHGYLIVYVKTKNGGKSFLVHRLVAENFICHPDSEQKHVNHIDGKKDNPKKDNLEWVTPKENTAHAYKTGLITSIGENSHLAKFTNEQVEYICQSLANGKRYSEILIDLGIEVTPNNMDMIGNIYRRIAWKAITSKYEFPEYDDRFRFHSKETIEEICKYIEQGYTNLEVCEKVFNLPKNSTSRSCKREYELVRVIRNKKYFSDISSKYNF